MRYLRQTPPKTHLPHGVVGVVGENLRNLCIAINLEHLYQPVQAPCYLKSHGVVTLINVLYLRIAHAAAFDLVLPLVLVQARLFLLIGVVP